MHVYVCVCSCASGYMHMICRNSCADKTSQSAGNVCVFKMKMLLV